VYSVHREIMIMAVDTQTRTRIPCGYKRQLHRCLRTRWDRRTANHWKRTLPIVHKCHSRRRSSPPQLHTIDHGVTCHLINKR